MAENDPQGLWFMIKVVCQNFSPNFSLTPKKRLVKMGILEILRLGSPKYWYENFGEQLKL